MPVDDRVEDFENLQRQGDEAFGNEDYGTARHYFEKALTLEPENSGIYLRIGACWHALEEYGEAEKNFKKALDIDSENPSAYFALAEFYKFTSREDLSIPLFEKYLVLRKEFNPGKIKALIYLAEIYTDKGEYQKAEIFCKEVLEVDGQNILAQIQFARILCCQSEFDNALKILHTLIVKTNDKEDLSLIFYMLGKIHIEKNDYIIAAEYLEKYNTMSSYPYSGLVLISQVYMDLERDIEALENMKQALKLNNQDYWDWINLGRIYVNLGNFDAAISATQKSLEIHESAEAYYYLAKIYYRQDLFDSVLKNVQNAISLNDSDPRFYAIASVVNLKLGDIQTGRDFAKKALIVKQNTNKSFIGGFQNLGNLLFKHKQKDLAEQCWQAETKYS